MKAICQKVNQLSLHHPKHPIDVSDIKSMVMTASRHKNDHHNKKREALLTLVVKSTTCIFHLLLRWRNHKGVLLPAWQISLKNRQYGL